MNLLIFDIEKLEAIQNEKPKGKAGAGAIRNAAQNVTSGQTARTRSNNAKHDPTWAGRESPDQAPTVPDRTSRDTTGQGRESSDTPRGSQDARKPSRARIYPV